MGKLVAYTTALSAVFVVMAAGVAVRYREAAERFVAQEGARDRAPEGKATRDTTGLAAFDFSELRVPRAPWISEPRLASFAAQLLLECDTPELARLNLDTTAVWACRVSGDARARSASVIRTR